MLTAINIALIIGALFIYFSFSPKLGGKNQGKELLKKE